MTRIPRIVGLALLAGLAGCLANRSDMDAPPPIEWSPEMQAIAEGNNRFAFDLYSKLREGKSGNLFFSPYSAHAALAMTTIGARGTTRDEMVKVLHLPGEDAKIAAAGDVGRYYAAPRKAYQLSVANAIWGQKNFPWVPEFLELQQTRFGAGFQEADFIANPDGERQRINRWVEEKTRDRIKDLIAEGLITPMTRMVLANAIHFKGQWQDQFDPKKTRPQPFTLADGSKQDTPMMHREGGFRHYVERGQSGEWQPDFQVAELPYKGGELSMVVLLPGKHDGLPTLEAKLSAENLAGWLTKSWDAKETGITVPKFRIVSDSMKLNEPLQKLGMVKAFDQFKADFTGLHSGNEQLYVDFVMQKAFVDVNEEGTEAAAATAVGVHNASAPLNFRADRPFLFLIRDTKRGTILFMGRYEKP